MKNRRHLSKARTLLELFGVTILLLVLFLASHAANASLAHLPPSSGDNPVVRVTGLKAGPSMVSSGISSGAERVTLSCTPSPGNNFLFLPYDTSTGGDWLERMTSAFDHHFPDYTCSEGPSAPSCVSRGMEIAIWEGELARPIENGGVRYCYVPGNTVLLSSAVCGYISGYHGVTGESAIFYDGHNGYDWGIIGGVTRDILAAASGTVVGVGTDGAYGLTVEVDHLNGYHTKYSHLSTTQVTTGSCVDAGQPIGKQGNTGHSLAVHLHFRVEHNGKITDPFGWCYFCQNPPPDPLIQYTQEASQNLWYGNNPRSVGQPPTRPNISMIWSAFHSDYLGGPGVLLPTDDSTPPSATGFAATAAGQTAELRPSGVQDNPGGSGIREVRFSAKWSGTWYGVGVANVFPYALDWNMCTSGVPDGDVELGMEVWDNAGNRWIWSEHYPNPHITKSYNCAPPPPVEGVYLYRNTGQSGGSCYFTQDAPSIGNYCQNAGYGSGWNDDAESVRVQGPYYFALYRDDNYSGGEPLTGNPTGDLPIEWRNQASSIRIRRNDPARFTLYDLGDFNGESFASDRTIYDFGHWAFNDRAESIRVAAGNEVIVCADSDFHGICGRTTSAAVSDINAVAQGLRNAVSSVRVCQGSCPPAPNSPTLVAPEDSAVLVAGQNVWFQWAGNGMGYLVKFWGGELSGPLESGWRNGTQWSPGTLTASNNPYYWQVKAWNDYGESGWSSTRSFYVRDPLPDLFPYAPPGYSGPVVLSSEAGTFVSGPVTAGELTYFDWHAANGGTAATSNGFYVDLLIDGQNRGRFPLSGLDRNQVGGIDDWSFTVSEAGWHTVKLVVDPLNMVTEVEEGNNEWAIQYYWNEPVSSPYDVDHDLDVDIVDVQLVAAHWGCSQGTACYNSTFDIDQSGEIDVQDIVAIAEHWNCTNPNQCYFPPIATPTSTPTPTATSTPTPTVTPTTTPPTSPQIDLIGQIGGLSYAVATHGATAYIGFGWQLTALDVADPSNPILLSRSPILSGIVKSIAVTGSYAYVATSAGALHAIDISNPSQLSLVGFLDSPGSGEDVVVAGSHAYLADGDGGLRVISISSPSSLVEVGSYLTPGTALGVHVAGSLAFMADSSAGLRILNVSIPSAPAEIGYLDTSGNAQDVAVAGQYAYLADGGAGFKVIDVGAPSSPFQVGSYVPISPAVTDLAIVGQHVYLVNTEMGLSVVDVTNPANPTPAGTYDTPGTAYGVSISGNDAYVADRYSVRVLDVSVLSAITQRSMVHIPAYWYIDSQGNNAFAMDIFKLNVINLTDPANPVVAAQLQISTYPQPFEIEISGNYAYVAGATDGLFVVDIANPLSPAQVGFLSPSYSMRALEVVGHFAYVLSQPTALHIIDIANPQSPVEVGSYVPTSGSFSGLTISNDRAYVITPGCGASLTVIDVSNPTNPHPIGSTMCVFGVTGMLASGDLVYVGVGSDLLVIDASDPSNLHTVGSCSIPLNSGKNLLQVGRYLYMGGSRDPVGVVDILNPTSPSFVVSTNVESDQNGEMAAVGTNIAIVNGNGGMSVVHFSGAEPLSLD